MASHNDLGKYGESLARNYLLNNGYTVLHNNWKHLHYEIDMIAAKENKLHFIEVKTRRTTTFGFPEESIDKKKFRNLQKAAGQFLHQYPQWKWVQYDVLSIFINKDDAVDYFYIEDVFII